MDSDNLQVLFDRIVLGLTIVNIGGKTFYIKDPRPMHRMIAQAKYDFFMNEFSFLGIPTKNDIKELLEKREVWNDNFDKELEELNNTLNLLEIELSKSKFRSNEKHIIQNKIVTIENKILKLENKKYALYANTIEYLAKMEYYKQLIFLLTYNESKKRVWLTEKDFNCADDKVIQKLVQAVFFNQNIKEVAIRKLSRSEPWRSTWLAACKTGHLFGRPLTQMTDLQRALVSWTLLYDNVLENPDRPSDDVINDDRQFDLWLKNYNKNKKTNNSNFTDNEKIANAAEVSIAVDSISDAEQVYNLNDSDAKRIISLREKTIVEKGHLKESELPDVRMDLQMRKNQLEKEHLKGR